MLNGIVWIRTICIKMDLRLNDIQKLICHKIKTTNQPTWHSRKFYSWILAIWLFNIISETLICGGESYLSSEIQLVYSIAPADWAVSQWVHRQLTILINGHDLSTKSADWYLTRRNSRLTLNYIRYANCKNVWFVLYNVIILIIIIKSSR